jgi:hypothetical protein
VVAVAGEWVVGTGLIVGDGATSFYFKEIMALPDQVGDRSSGPWWTRVD